MDANKFGRPVESEVEAVRAVITQIIVNGRADYQLEQKLYQVSDASLACLNKDEADLLLKHAVENRNGGLVAALHHVELESTDEVLAATKDKESSMGGLYRLSPDARVQKSAFRAGRAGPIESLVQNSDLVPEMRQRLLVSKYKGVRLGFCSRPDLKPDEALTLLKAHDTGDWATEAIAKACMNRETIGVTLLLNFSHNVKAEVSMWNYIDKRHDLPRRMKRAFAQRILDTCGDYFSERDTVMTDIARSKSVRLELKVVERVTEGVPK